MAWEPIDIVRLQRRMADGLQAAGEELRSFYRQTARGPEKWDLHPWGDPGGGFWVVALHEDRVLWYNDIEDGFNVSAFEREGLISRDQYWCNQDGFQCALMRLRDGGSDRLGPARPLRR